MCEIERYLNLLDDRKQAVLSFHEKHAHLFNAAKGSSHNHQVWEGGYRDHITHCFLLADLLWYFLPNKFTLSSALIVLYFHDIEKIWKYTEGLPENFDKKTFYELTLPKKYGIAFTDQELNALQYIHGELQDYRSDQRVMNELAGFCHAIDTLSARTLWDVKKLP